MDRLAFIDDDEDELARVRELVEGAYEFVPIHWPRQKPTEALAGRPPALFVSDLYMPPPDHPVDPTDHPKEVLEAHAAMPVAALFSQAITAVKRTTTSESQSETNSRSSS
jgi:hypothetical protein